MPRHVFEEQDVGLVALLKEGKPAGTAVKFVLFRDGTELKQVDGQVVADANAPAGKAATTKYKADPVPPDKPSYVLTFKAVADGDEYKGGDEIHVWPKKGKLAAVRDEDPAKALPGLKFKVMQNGAQFGPVHTAETDKAETEFALDKGTPFAVEHADPYEIKSIEKKGTALRDLKAKGLLKFEAEFVNPKRPGDGQIKQWVNLIPDAAKKGTDGLGPEVEIEVGVKGDRDEATGATKATVIGKAGMFVFIKVKFSGQNGKKSKRNSPKTDLVAGLELSARTAVKEAAADPQWEYTGKVELKGAGGTGKFKVNLGMAGGDTCEIELGSSATLGGPKLTFTNWRKIWYELMAPDFMELEERVDPVLGKVRDFAAAGLTNTKTSGDNTFVVYELFKSHKFTEAEAETTSPGSIMKREFFELTAGNAKVYVLTDLTFKNYPKNFDKGKGLRATCLKACDINLYSDGPGTDDPIDRSFSATTAAAEYDIWASDADIYWLPKSGSAAGTDTIRKIDWIAEIATPDTYKRRPTVEFDADEDRADADDKTRVITVRETLQGKTVDIKYKNPAVGHVPTDLDATRKAALDSLLSGLYTVATLRSKDNKLKFKLTGLTGDDRRTARFQAIKDYLTSKVGSSAPRIPVHPGLDDAGALRKGALTWSTVVDMTKSNHHKFALDLPAASANDPGKFVGALSDTKCPIKITIRFEPHHGGNGLAGAGAQKGEILVRWGINCPLSITDTFLHELGHQYDMSAYNIAADAHAPGLRKPKNTTEAEDINEYKNVGANGHYYDRHGHAGPHCAWGLSDVEKALASYGGLTGTCTMYGEGPRDDTRRKRLAFCTQCTDYIRARDLSALK
jgi:hypothetical protein